MNAARRLTTFLQALERCCRSGEKWLAVAVFSALVLVVFGNVVVRASRTPEILADAAYLIFQKPARSFSGHFLIDDTFLAGEGVIDFRKYRVDPSVPLSPDFFVPDDVPPPRL